MYFNRPRGQRPEPESAGGANGSQFGNMFNTGGFQMSFGIGAFPFGFFATNFNWGKRLFVIHELLKKIKYKRYLSRLGY